MSRRLPFLPAVLLAALVFSPVLSRAESAGQTLFNQANASLEASDYPAAIQAYKDLIAKYPSETFIPNAWFYLGLAQLSGGQPDQALDSFKKLFDPQAPADLKESAVFYSGQAAFTQAGKVPEAQRAPLFKKAVDFFGQYLKDYPQGEMREPVLFSRSQVELYQSDFDAAQKDLAALLADYPKSNSRIDYLYWTGRGYALQSDALLKADKDAEAAATAKKAIAAFDQISETPSAVMAENDAFEEKAALLMRMASSDADYQEAIAAYRKVRAKDQLVPLQQAVLADLSKQIAQAALTKNKSAYQSLMERRQRAQSRLDDLKEGADPAVDAFIRIAQALVYLKRQDEARVLLRYVKPFASAPEQKQQISYLGILAYATEGMTAQADAAFQQHKTDFAQDPSAPKLRLIIASELQKEKDLAGAEAQYRKYLDESPDGQYADQAAVALGNLLLVQKKEADAAASLDAFLKKKPAAANAGEARYLLGTALAAQKKNDEAIAQFKLVAADAKAGHFQADAALQQGFTLVNAQRYDEAIAALQAAVKQFPQADQAALADYYQGVAQEQKKDPAAAIAAYEQTVRDYPQHAMASKALAQVIRLDAGLGKNDEMIAAAKRLMAAYPQAPEAATAGFTLAQAYEKQRDWPNAAAQYQAVVALPGSPAAPMAQAKLAVMWINAARALGSYKALSDDEKKEWQADTDKALEAAVQGMEKFPAARETGVALEEIVRLVLLKVDAGLLTADQGAAVFSDWAAKVSGEPAKGRLDLARIAVLVQRGKADQAVALYQQAESAHPGLVYGPEDLERQGGALLAAKQYDKATPVFERLQKEFPKEPRAQAAAVYGLGAVQLAQGNATAADPYFDTLEKQYPWSDKIWEATLGRGLAAENRNDMAQARTYYQKVIMAPASSPEMKARGLFGFAHSLEKEGKTLPNAAAPNEPNAVNNYLKIDALFDAARGTAAEGLWRAGQIYEKANQNDKAKQAYQTLAKKYAESEFAGEAQARVAALGG